MFKVKIIRLRDYISANMLHVGDEERIKEMDEFIRLLTRLEEDSFSYEEAVGYDFDKLTELRNKDIDVFVLPKVKYIQTWKIFGFIFFPITFTLFYSMFFEREAYVIRKSLLRYLEGHQDRLVITDRYFSWVTFKISNTLSIEYFGTVQSWALFEEGECILSSFSVGKVSTAYYNKILAMIKSKI